MSRWSPDLGPSTLPGAAARRLTGVMRAAVKLTLASAAASVAASLLVTRALRWEQRWGATEEEVAARLTGDGSVAEPAADITRAITIEAPPEQVWPWLVQLGADRGGFYSYDCLENAVGLGIHSADDIVPAWQDLRVGDVVWATRKRTAGWYVVGLVAHEALVLKAANIEAGRPLSRYEPPGWEFAWIFALSRTATAQTRLLVRERIAFGPRSTRVLMAPVGPVSFVMTRRMMLGIKRRAEAMQATPVAS